MKKLYFELEVYETLLTLYLFFKETGFTYPSTIFGFHYNNYVGFCYSLEKLGYTVDVRNSGYNFLTNKLPALYLLRPKTKNVYSYWYTLDEKGLGQRIELLYRAIELVEVRIMVESLCNEHLVV